MDDLISRQAAIDEIRKCRFVVDAIEKIRGLPSAQPEPIKINIEDFNKEDWERLRKEWGNTPITVLSAQPELIRCKDCKHWYSDADAGMACDYTNITQPEDGFCNWAERKTNADN